MVTAAMEILFCWLDLNTLRLLGCRTLPARLGLILRPAPRDQGATTSNTNCLRAGPGASPTQAAQGFPPSSPEAMAWFQGKEEEERKWRGGGMRQGEGHLYTNCSQLWPSSSPFSCQELQPAGSSRLLSTTGSGARESLHRERDSPPSIHRLCIGISIIIFIYSPYQQEQPLCLLSPQRQHPHEGN